MRRRSTVVIAALLCAALLPGAVSAAGPSFSPGAAGAGDPYYPLDGNGGYDVKHYDLVLDYQPDTDILRGTETISARASQDLSSFDLDFVGLNVRSIKVDGRNATWIRDGQELIITPRHGLPKNHSFKVVIRYDGVPEPTLDPFGGVSGFVATDDGAIIAGEPHGAATWFPANDHPIDKASFTFKVSVPKGLQVVANGKLTGRHTHHGQTTWSWNAAEPMATYLADGQHRRVRHPCVSKARDQVLGRGRSGPPRSGRGADDRLAVRHLAAGGFVVQTAPSHHPHPGRRGDGRLQDHQGHRARMGLRLRRGPYGRAGRLDDLAGRERAYRR